MKKWRGVLGRAKVKGWKTRLNRKHELKFTTYRYVGPGDPPQTWFNIRAFANQSYGTVIWSNNVADSQGNVQITWPQQGDGQGNIEGNRFNSLYAEVIFDVLPGLPTTGEIQGTFPFETLRLYVIRKRDPNTTLSAASLWTIPTLNGTPINSKNWDIQMDRTYQYTTGYSPATTNIIDPPPNIVATTSLVPKPKRFRIIIPLRHTMNLQAPNAANAFPLSIYIMALTSYQDANLLVNNLSCTYYYKDP